MNLEEKRFLLIETWQESGLSKREFLSDKDIEQAKFNYWQVKINYIAFSFCILIVVCPINRGSNHKATDTQFPSFTGEGHLEGEPSGNRAAYLEYMFGKNMIIDDLWQMAQEIIKSNGTAYTNGININQHNNQIDFYNFKNSFVPSFLELVKFPSNAQDSSDVEKYKYKVMPY